MHTLTAEEISLQPQRFLADTRRGEVTVVTDGGQAVMLAVPLEHGPSVHTTLIELAAQLYDKELISLERAARIAGLSYSETIDEFGRRGIATIRLTPDELERELAAFGT
jgi:predicted HTH domain antitoxin